jgi:hypothetical protein
MNIIGTHQLFLSLASRFPEDDCLTESESSSNGKESSSHTFVNEISDASLFIGDLSREVVEKDLLDAFSPFGDVTEVIVKRSRTTKIPLGYGFVTMQSPEMAQLCVEKCQNLVIKGRKIRIGKAHRNSSLFISQLDPTLTLPALLQLFAGFGQVVAEESLLAPCGRYPPTPTPAYFLPLPNSDFNDRGFAAHSSLYGNGDHQVCVKKGG